MNNILESKQLAFLIINYFHFNHYLISLEIFFVLIDIKTNKSSKLKIDIKRIKEDIFANWCEYVM